MSPAAEPTIASTSNARLTSEVLANWIDERFSAAWQESKIVPTEVVGR